MAITNTFQEAVDNGSIRKIRIMMKDSLWVDPSFTDFAEMERAASSVAGLYDRHDGEVFEKKPDLWNEDYLAGVMVDVVGNFSHERIEHLKEVVKYLRPVKKENPGKQSMSRYDHASDTKSRSYREQKEHDQMSGTYRYAVIGGGAVAGGIVGGAIGAAASVNGLAFAGCVLGGAVIGGVAAAYFVDERR